MNDASFWTRKQTNCHTQCYWCNQLLLQTIFSCGYIGGRVRGREKRPCTVIHSHRNKTPQQSHTWKTACIAADCLCMHADMHTPCSAQLRNMTRRGYCLWGLNRRATGSCGGHHIRENSLKGAARGSTGAESAHHEPHHPEAVLHYTWPELGRGCISGGPSQLLAHVTLRGGAASDPGWHPAKPRGTIPRVVPPGGASASPPGA